MGLLNNKIGFQHYIDGRINIVDLYTCEYYCNIMLGLLLRWKRVVKIVYISSIFNMPFTSVSY